MWHPATPSHCGAPSTQAIGNGVPIVIFDSGLKDMSGIVSYVATNNERGGQVRR